MQWSNATLVQLKKDIATSNLAGIRDFFARDNATALLNEYLFYSQYGSNFAIGNTWVKDISPCTWSDRRGAFRVPDGFTIDCLTLAVGACSASVVGLLLELGSVMSEKNTQKIQAVIKSIYNTCDSWRPKLIEVCTLLDMDSGFIEQEKEKQPGKVNKKKKKEKRKASASVGAPDTPAAKVGSIFLLLVLLLSTGFHFQVCCDC